MDVKGRPNYEKRAKRREIRLLHEAIDSHDVGRVQELLGPETDVNFHYGGQSALQKAVIQGDFNISKVLIEHGADVNKSNAEDNTLLNMVAWRGYHDIAQLLVESGADINVYNNHTSTPLNTAAYKGHTEVVRILSSHPDCDVNRPNDRRQTPLCTAAREGHIDVIKVLVDAGADLEWADTDRKTPLIAAVEKCQHDSAKLLLEAGCEPDASDRYGCTALWFAANQGQYDTTHVLIQAKVDLNKTDHRGSSPFMEAVKSLHLDVVQLLADSGCDVNLREHSTHQSAINIAVRLASQFFGDKARHEAQVKLLLDVGCDVNNADKTGWTAVYHAAFGGELEVVRMLLGKHADLTMVTENGQTALHGAVFGNSVEIIRLLLDKGSRVNAVDKNFRTPLYLAINHRCKPKILEMLLESGSGTEIQELEEGRMPLFAAVEQQYTEAVDLLIQYKCNVNATDKHGDTTLWLACDKGNEDIVASLLRQPCVDVDKGLTHIPLHAAVRHGLTNTVKRLLHAGCTVNKLTDLGTSALYFAADVDNVPLAKLLIHYGANPCAPYSVRVPSKCCFTYSDKHPHLELEPLQCALRNDSFAMIKVILEGSPQMPYKVLATLRDLVFRTDYVRDARLGQRLVVQYAHFFSMVLHHPRRLQEACRGRVRTSLGERPFDKVEKLPVPGKIQDYLLMKDSLLKEFYR